MRNSVSDVTDAEILDEAREAMTQAAFDAADEANAAQAVESATESLPAFDELGLSDEIQSAAGGVRLGGVLSLSPVATAFNWFSCPLSPHPRSQSDLPGGKGEPQSLFRRGLRPRHPCTEPPAARTAPAVPVPGGRLARLVAG